MENEENKSDSEDFKVVIRDIKDEEFEAFQNTLSFKLIKELYSIFKIYEKKGVINYDIYLESMTQIFKKYNKSNDFKYIFDLIFNRFQKIKCILKNNKTVFYLTEMVHKNAIETYIIACFLTILIKCGIVDKIKLLFKLTDIDDDGYLNKAEIKKMISTINFLFCGNSEININSSILSQSLMNINVKEKINKLMNEPGNLGVKLENEKYVNFDTFFKSLEKIENYKYEIIPCFINIRKCLFSFRKEKILEIKNKNKKEFVRATSALSNIKPRGPTHLFKKNFSSNLERLIKNVKKNNDDELIDFNNYGNNMDFELLKKKNSLLGIKERNKSFKELLKESTILSGDEDEDNKDKKKHFKKNMSRNYTPRQNYIFEADFDKIKKIEVEPALLRFSKDNIFNKSIKRYNSNAYLLNSNKENNSILKNFRHKNTIDLNKDINNMNFRNIQSAKNNNKIKGKTINFNFDLSKRSSILPLNYKSNIFQKLNQPPPSNKNQKHNNSMKVINFSLSSMEKILEKSSYKKNKSSFNTRKINNINIYKQPINKFFTPINNKRNVKIQFRIDQNNLLKGNSTTKNKNKKNITIKDIKNLTYNQVKSTKKNISYNKIFQKNRNRNINNKNFFLVNNRFNKYLNINEILKDLDDEEKLAHEKSYYLEKELITLYNKLIKERSKIKEKINTFNEADFSLHFYDLKEKIFPDSYGRKINSFHKIKLNN